MKYLVIVASLLLVLLFFSNIFFRAPNGQWIFKERSDYLKTLFTKKKSKHKQGSDKVGRKETGFKK